MNLKIAICDDMVFDVDNTNVLINWCFKSR